MSNRLQKDRNGWTQPEPCKFIFTGSCKPHSTSPQQVARFLADGREPAGDPPDGKTLAQPHVHRIVGAPGACRSVLFRTITSYHGRLRKSGVQCAGTPA